MKNLIHTPFSDIVDTWRILKYFLIRLKDIGKHIQKLNTRKYDSTDLLMYSLLIKNDIFAFTNKKRNSILSFN